MDLEKFHSKHWEFTYDRKMSYQRMHLFHYGYCTQLSQFFNIQIHSEVYRTKNENTSVYYEKNDHAQAIGTIVDLLAGSSSEEWFRKMRDTIEVFYEEFIKKVHEKRGDYSGLSNQDLAQSLRDFTIENEKISLPTWLLYLYIEEVLTAEIKKRLAQRELSEGQIAQIIATLATPTEVTPLDAYHTDLYSIVLVAQSDQGRALEEFTNKYNSWEVFDVNFDVLDVSAHEEKIKNVSPQEAKTKIEEIEDKYTKQKKELADREEWWRGDKSIKTLIELYLFYVNFKDWKNYHREQSSYKMKILFEEIADRTSLSQQQIAFLMEEEIIDLLEGKLTLSSDDIHRRIEDSALVFLEGKQEIVTDRALLKEIDGSLTTKQVQTITGTVAYKGVARGKVKIIFSIKDAEKVVEGDVLVSSTTRPDYLPFMKKASAFVTNEGGMLSHAAIMARELKKPCIIGTKIATQVLKDGDMVEVDAESGVVRILD